MLRLLCTVLFFATLHVLPWGARADAQRASLPAAGAADPDAVPGRDPRFERFLAEAERAAAEPFLGITADGRVERGLFARRPGASTARMEGAAVRLLRALDERQRAAVRFPLRSDEWRRWSNVHRYPRQGLALRDMSPAQRVLAWDLLRASLSEEGFRLAADIARLNQVLAARTGKPDEYGEQLYWFSLFGEPGAGGPWGWQMDGHHLNVNYLVVGGQVVATPMFLGSEPVRADSGLFAGTRVFEAEESLGLAFARTLNAQQRRMAVVGDTNPSDVAAAGFRDNVVVPYRGIAWGDLRPEQQRALVELVRVYTGRLRAAHADAWLAEIRAHLPRTRFAWAGGMGDEDMFYYRIHSPVVLIEFNHQRGLAVDPGRAGRNHIHSTVRTPNGNDYGRALLDVAGAR